MFVLFHQVSQGSIEVTSTTADPAPSPAGPSSSSPPSTKTTTTVIVPSPSGPDVTVNSINSGASGEGGATAKPLVAKRITIKTVGGPTTEANQIVLTDEIIRLLIKFGQAQVTVYNQ